MDTLLLYTDNYPPMESEQDQSLVEISIGDNQLRMEGTEQFLSDELSKVLDRIDLSENAELKTGEDQKVKPEEPEPDKKSESESKKSELGDYETSSEEADSELHKVAKRLGLDQEVLAEHFYIDDDGIHIQSPLDIEPKYAVLGYCTIKEILSGDTYHNNKETKDKLIDIEKVEIEKWGSNLLYDLRSGGLIKDNPNVNQDRNKPFKITPSGRRELVEWLNEDS